MAMLLGDVSDHRMQEYQDFIANLNHIGHVAPKPTQINPMKESTRPTRGRSPTVRRGKSPTVKEIPHRDVERKSSEMPFRAVVNGVRPDIRPPHTHRPVHNPMHFNSQDTESDVEWDHDNSMQLEFPSLSLNPVVQKDKTRKSRLKMADKDVLQIVQESRHRVKLGINSNKQRKTEIFWVADDEITRDSKRSEMPKPGGGDIPAPTDSEGSQAWGLPKMDEKTKDLSWLFPNTESINCLFDTPIGDVINNVGQLTWALIAIALDSGAVEL